MSKKHFRLVLEDTQTVSFKADNAELKYRLHAAFIEFVEAYGLRCAVLYVKHSSQGWQQVLDYNKRYSIINNPLKLNYSHLSFAVIHTLKQCDELPTPEERQQRREKLLREEREQWAQARRESFYIVEHT